MYECMCVHTYTHACVHACLHVHACTRACMHMHVYGGNMGCLAYMHICLYNSKHCWYHYFQSFALSGLSLVNPNKPKTPAEPHLHSRCPGRSGTGVCRCVTPAQPGQWSRPLLVLPSVTHQTHSITNCLLTGGQLRFSHFSEIVFCLEILLISLLTQTC